MKIEITQSFVMEGHAAFNVGERLDVPDELADTWITAGRALPADKVRTFKNKPSPFLYRREKGTKKRGETR